jgi:hypothetical protein
MVCKGNCAGGRAYYPKGLHQAAAEERDEEGGNRIIT